jgi:UDP-glucose 4-epimerase
MVAIVVTGGAGFIGSHIADAFSAAGSEVQVIDDLSSGLRENLSVDVPLTVTDIRTEAARKFLTATRPEIIIHAAAQMSVTQSMQDPLFDAEVNICGLINLLQAFKPEELPYILFLSTGGALYGEQTVFPATEDHRINPTSAYGLAKRVEELYLDLWSRQWGLRYGVLRLANIYGPRQSPHGEAGVVAIFNNLLLKGEVPTLFGHGKPTRDYVFVADVVNAVQKMCDDRITGTYNIGTGRETAVSEIFNLISKALKVDLLPDYAPLRTGEQERSSIDATLALKTFNWKPTVDLENGLRLTSEWFRGKL